MTPRPAAASPSPRGAGGAARTGRAAHALQAFPCGGGPPAFLPPGTRRAPGGKAAVQTRNDGIFPTCLVVLKVSARHAPPRQGSRAFRPAASTNTPCAGRGTRRRSRHKEAVLNTPPFVFNPFVVPFFYHIGNRIYRREFFCNFLFQAIQ